MGTRAPRGSGKKGKVKVKTVDEVYDVIDHELKPYQPKVVNAASMSDKIIRKLMKVDPSTPSPKQGTTYKKKKKK